MAHTGYRSYLISICAVGLGLLVLFSPISIRHFEAAAVTLLGAGSITLHAANGLRPAMLIGRHSVCLLSGLLTIGLGVAYLLSDMPSRLFYCLTCAMAAVMLSSLRASHPNH